MNEHTLEKMKELRFHGMHEAFSSVLKNEQTNSLNSDELVAHLIDHEYDDRKNRKIERLIKNAKFRYNASLEEVVYSSERQLDKTIVARLGESNYIKESENILITGSTGVGKSYLACALGAQACYLGFKVIYHNSAKLFGKLKMAKADGSYLRELAKLERLDLLILDDYGLQELDKESRSCLMDIVEDRYQRSSMIITSQLPVDSWYDIIKEKTFADAILDRITHNAKRLELVGESMRKQTLKKQ